MKFRIPHWPLLLFPWLAFATGFTLNALVMLKNGGQMPVLFPGGAQDGFNVDMFHCAMTAKTHWKFLCDWIVLNGLGIASPGDFFEWAFELTLLPFLYVWITLVIRDWNTLQ